MAKILVVDDSMTVRTDLRKVLEAAGHQVIEAGNGRKGLETICALKDINLVITDLNMPEMHGMEMLKQAREKLGTPHYKTFVHTSDRVKSIKEQGAQIGVTAWMIKPFNPTQLVAAIEKVLGTK